MKKILLVFGTRPEAIKMAPVIQRLKAHNSKFKTVVCVTAQHRKMLDQVLSLFKITPDYDLDIMTYSQDLFDITACALTGLKDILKRERPDMVLVQGDTSSAFIAALAAYYLKIAIGHIEAGLRTHNKFSPFPEEKNRHLLSVLADFHFAPTEWAKSNLIREGVRNDRIWVTGNTVIDALQDVVGRQNKNGNFWYSYFKDRWGITLPVDKEDLKLILVTGHRRENFGEGVKNICMALKEITERRKNVLIVYPVHLNPNVRVPVNAILNGTKGIHLTDPLEYEPFVFIMKESFLILTDSGGVQEEAPSLGKPVLVMRDTTERPEGVEAGAVKLVGTGKDRIVNEILNLLDNPIPYEQMSKIVNPYGDGRAAERITRVLEDLYE